MLEKKIETAVCDYARSKGLGAYKFTSPSRRAVPDRIFFSPLGFVFLIEFKRTGEKATVPQAREHTKLRAYGQTVYVVDDIAQGKTIVDKYLNPWWTQ